jgi:hypothetical protein
MRFSIGIILLLLLSACGEKLFTGDVNCSECYSPKPDSLDLIIDLSIDDEFKKVPLVIYRGDVEDNQIEYIDTAYASPYRLYVAVGTKYSVKAKYRKADSTVLYAVDGTTIKILLVTATCDVDCYVIKNDRMNVKIRRKFRDF